MKIFRSRIRAGQIKTLLYVLTGSVWGAALYLNGGLHLRPVSVSSTPQASQSLTVPMAAGEQPKQNLTQIAPAAAKSPEAIAPPAPQRSPSTSAPSASSQTVPPPVTETFATETPRLVIRLSQKKVTLYRGAIAIKSYPVAIGRAGWETPKGEFQVMRMLKNPTWINPLTDATIPGGSPANPLGKYWIAFWTDGTNWIGFHGTPNPSSVGTAASHGCIRMYNADVEELFQQVTPGTPVTVE